MMDISSFLTNDQANVVELYFCPSSLESSNLSFKCAWNELPKLPIHLFKNRLDQMLTEFCHRDLVYTYDRSNDSQRLCQRTWLQDHFQGSQYVVVFQEETLPTHRFPCTQEINEQRTIHKIHYKINNRLYLIVEKEKDEWIIYLRYQHASNVEMDKMNEDWKYIVNTLRRSIYV